MSDVWSVRLLLDDEADKALVDPGVIPFGKSIIRLGIGGWAGSGIDDVPYIAFELQADGFDDAVDLAQRLVEGALREQGVKPRRLEIAWAAPVRDASLRGHLFLEQAKELFETEQYELAIVAAQMHFEAQVLLLMERASERIGAAWAKRLLTYRGVATLSSDVSRGGGAPP